MKKMLTILLSGLVCCHTHAMQPKRASTKKTSTTHESSVTILGPNLHITTVTRKITIRPVRDDFTQMLDALMVMAARL